MFSATLRKATRGFFGKPTRRPACSRLRVLDLEARDVPASHGVMSAVDPGMGTFRNVLENNNADRNVIRLDDARMNRNTFALRSQLEVKQDVTITNQKAIGTGTTKLDDFRLRIPDANAQGNRAGYDKLLASNVERADESGGLIGRAGESRREFAARPMQSNEALGRNAITFASAISLNYELTYNSTFAYSDGGCVLPGGNASQYFHTETSVSFSSTTRYEPTTNCSLVEGGGNSLQIESNFAFRNRTTAYNSNVPQFGGESPSGFALFSSTTMNFASTIRSANWSGDNSINGCWTESVSMAAEFSITGSSTPSHNSHGSNNHDQGVDIRYSLAFNGESSHTVALTNGNGAINNGPGGADIGTHTIR